MPLLRRTPFLAVALLAAAACSDSTAPRRAAAIDRIALQVVLPDSIDVGATLALRAEAQDSMRFAVAGVPVAWRSLSPAIATVDSAGVLTARDSGDARIVMSAQGAALVEDTILVRVRWLPRTVSIAPLPDSLRLGGRLAPTATVRDGRGRTLVAPVRWSSDGVLGTNAATGSTAALDEGTGYLFATVGPARDSVRVRGVPWRPARGIAMVEVQVGAFSGRCGRAADDRVWCWGGDGDGETGDGTSTVSDTALLVPGVRLRSITMGEEAVCGLDADGQAWCWGIDRYSQFGRGLPSDRSTRWTPVRAMGTRRYTQLGLTDHSQNCGIGAADSVVYCVGHNDSYQLGRGPRASQDTVVAPVTGALRATQVDGGGFHGCAIAVDTSTWCWGLGGQAGTDSTFVMQPRQLALAGTFVRLATGGGGTCGLAADGRVSCWGPSVNTSPSGSGGQWARTPQLVGGDTRFRAIDLALERDACGIALDGTLHCWSLPHATGGVMMPLPRMATRRFIALDLGTGTGCAVTTEREVLCW